MKDIPIWLRYASALAGILGVLWTIYIYIAPSVTAMRDTNQAATVLSADSVANSINIADILARYSVKETSLAKQNFLTTYENSAVYGIGSFTDIGKAGDGYLVTLKGSGNLGSCNFAGDVETEKRLLILDKGQEVAFTGTFTGAVV